MRERQLKAGRCAPGGNTENPLSKLPVGKLLDGMITTNACENILLGWSDGQIIDNLSNRYRRRRCRDAAKIDQNRRALTKRRSLAKVCHSSLQAWVAIPRHTPTIGAVTEAIRVVAECIIALTAGPQVPSRSIIQSTCLAGLNARGAGVDHADYFLCVSMRELWLDENSAWRLGVRGGTA